ncbi:MAG: cytochrome c peroxidase [Pseudomonadota bacterium]
MQRLFHLAFTLLLALPARAEPLRPLTDADFPPVDPAHAKIGQLLFYDKILSGNQNISCGTCHHHDHAGSDGLSLGIGEGGTGLGPERTPGTGAAQIRKRIPRNAPALWNLGHADVRILFHDGRLSFSDAYDNRFDSPAEEWLPPGLSGLLAAQALFPLTAQFEMAGNPAENEVAGAVHDRIDAAWPILAKRVRTIPAYGKMFVDGFDHIDAPADVTITEVANAIGAFIATEWRNHDSPFDAWLAGEPDALAPQAERGRALFYGAAGCAMCHSGPLLTDQSFHALALPAFGPGRTRRFDPFARDVGRMAESDRLEDAYRFRTPALRNVALTAPYGHNGAYATLTGIVRHHLDPLAALDAWDRDEARLPPIPWLEKADFLVQSDMREMARQRARVDIVAVELNDIEIAEVVAFLESLTGRTAKTRPLGRPETVPSGLPVD